MPHHLLPNTSPSTSLFRPVRPVQNPYRRSLTKLCASCAALWLVTGALGILGIAPGLTFGVAHAEDFIIDTDVTDTNGGETIDGDDSLTITETGSIVTTDAVGINAPGGGNTVTNWGSITASGRNADGIFFSRDGGNMVTNWGRITTDGILARGIHVQGSGDTVTNWGNIKTSGDRGSGIDVEGAGGDNAVVNWGSITTGGVRADGIFLKAGNSFVTNRGGITVTGFASTGIKAWAGDNTLTNWGSITATGDKSVAVEIKGVKNTVINWGSITTTRHKGHGISSPGGGKNEITNAGSITTEGWEAYGIYVENDNNIVTNWGSITTSGIGARGIWAVNSTNNTVTNGGKVVSAQFHAIEFNGTGNTLELEAPGYLGGRIWLSLGTEVNLKTGPSHSVLWDFSEGTMTGAPSFSGPVTGFYNETTKQFATFDPTVLAGTVNQLGHLQGQLSDVARHGLREGLNADRVVGSDTDSATFGHPQGLLPGDGSIWATGFGGTYEHDGDAATLARDIEQKGGALGYSWSAHDNLQLSAMAGYLWGRQQAESRWAESYSLDTNGAFAGLHGGTSLGMFAFDFGAVGGRLTHDSDRFVNDNLAPLGVSWATASYNSWFFNPEVGVSTAIDVARVTITPALRLAYAQQWFDGYSETGSKANATVGAQSLGLLSATAEIKIEKQISDNASLNLTGGYLARKIVGDEAANIQLVGISNAVGFGDTDSNSFTLGGGLSFNVGEHASIGATITTFFGDTFTGTQGMATVKIRF